MKLAGLFVLLLPLLPLPAFARAPAAPITIQDLPLEKVGANIYVVHGKNGLPNSRNRGFMNNPAAIVTSQGVVVVDPGSSAEIGKELLKKIRGITAKPVIAIFNTHAHGDHWLGNDGIHRVYPKAPIYADERAIERLKTGEDQQWFTRFMTMTQGAIAGTKAVIPTVGLKDGETITLGDTVLRIRSVGHAHSDGDITIEVVNEKALFTGDIVTNKTIPSAAAPQDASVKGEIAAIQEMLRGNDTLFIPGHGRSGGRELPEATLRYLQALRGAVLKYYQQGLTAADMKEAVIQDLKEFQDWHGFNEIGRVITYVYQEVEQEAF